MSSRRSHVQTLFDAQKAAITRRHFFGRTATGVGTAALGSILASNGLLRADTPTLPTIVPGEPGILKTLHHAPKAKRVIYLFMNGAPSQIDLFDPKPAMQEMFDKDLPASVINGQRFTTMTSGQTRFPIAPSTFKFARHGKAGTWVSELLPHTAKVVDELCVIKSMHTEAINHDPAATFITTGSQIPGRPSLGAWLAYGLGSGNRDLPAFVVMTASWTGRKSAQAIYERLWGSGFLASRHSGVRLRSDGDPVLYLDNPAGVSGPTRRAMLDTLAQMNEQSYEQTLDPEIRDRIAQYEMAFRMQASVPELTDMSGETQETLDLYGPEVNTPGTFASSCLLARRLAERGVNVVQIFHRGWDQHGGLPKDITNQCHDVDQASAALITDLKRRGMLDDTLVVWGGEFGRTMYCQGYADQDRLWARSSSSLLHDLDGRRRCETGHHVWPDG